jgi:hypothetical protein
VARKAQRQVAVSQKFLSLVAAVTICNENAVTQPRFAFRTLLKYLSSQARPILLLDHSNRLVVKKTWCSPTSTLCTQPLQSSPFASKITPESIALPSAHTVAKTVIHSLELSCKPAVTLFYSQSCFEKTRFCLKVTPIRKPFTSIL